MNSESHFPQLSREIDHLGRICGEIIRHMAGKENFELVERLRLLVREMHDGDAAAESKIRKLLSGMDERQIKVVTRGFTIFLELSNLAEDRRRVRVLRQRKRDAYPEPASETIAAAIANYHEQGLSSSDVQGHVDALRIDLVLTAHPTEAKRRAVRRLLGNMRDILAEQDHSELMPSEKDRLETLLHARLSTLWQTDYIRPWRPTVLQEVERGLAVKVTLWQQIPEVMDDLRHALAKYYPKVKLRKRPIVEYGSWIGGDRDGNPFVTPEVTEQTITWLRREAINSHLAVCDALTQSLSLSDRQTPAAPCLLDATNAAARKWPEVQERLAKLPPLEAYRRWLFVVHWRLQQTAKAVSSAEEVTEGAYSCQEELYDDVAIVVQSLKETGNENLVATDVQPWLDQILTFGLHMARLDIRQDSGLYRGVVNEILATTELVPNIAELEEVERREALIKTMGAEFELDLEQVAPETRETLELFTLLRRVVRSYGMEALGEHILSMTRVPSDLLTIMWFWRWSERVDGGDPRDAELLIPIVPLFETINDLNQAPQTMTELLSEPTYREYLAKQGDQQTVMIGYSDSSKDGGYLAAQWALQNSQTQIMRVANEKGVKLTFFHGRGGSLARGGGPAAKGVLSLPDSAFKGALRITEQGEVLADRYDNPEIAHRHLEQLIWSVLTAVSRPERHISPDWHVAIRELADASLKVYRQLVDHPSFADFYRAVTPINSIEQLPIGSRPSKRKKGNRVEDLRAIPWVYSWTQCRALIPAWYGLGSGIEAFLEGGEESRLKLLSEMYQRWPFFRILLDNASVSLSQANMPVFRWYAELSKDIPESQSLADSIIEEHQRTCHAVAKVLGQQELLEKVPWLKRSIKVRNGYVDSLNLLQCELLQRAANKAGSTEVELEHLIHLTIKGVSTGMRTTG